MTVQTIPEIDQMTAAQQIELMEALWKSMSESVVYEAPEWHRQCLADREVAVGNEEDSFISLDELEADLRAELK
jgi:hypothetical protein